MSQSFVAACIQNDAGRDLQRNLDRCGEWALKANRAGAQFIAMPEFFSYLHVADNGLEAGACLQHEHPALLFMADLARETRSYLLLGSLAILTGPQRASNRSFLLDPEGEIIVSYDKIHMFDVDLAKGESYRESDLFTAGCEAVYADTKWCRVGLSVCYDLRFAYLYRTLAQNGAELLTVPAAFAHRTGTAHWHVLNQARAIETGSFVVAPCQSGTHGKFHTYGHSLIIGPWGEILADAGDEEGYIVAEIDLSQVAAARQRIPALSHDRQLIESATSLSKPGQL